MWLAVLDEVPAATLTLQWVDPLWPDDGAAGYLHRFAVHRRAAGLGARLLEWTADVVREAGRDRLRLECVAANSALRAYYERAGFRHVDDVPLPTSVWSTRRPLMSRYERRVDR